MTNRKTNLLVSLVSIFAVVSIGVQTALAGNDDQSSKKMTVKDFYLGMCVKDIESVIAKYKLAKSKYGDRLYNQCAGSGLEYKVVPMIEGGMSSVEPHLFDQSCQIQEYDLLGSTSEVSLVLHNDELVWAHFYTTGSNLAGSNDTLIRALNKKYGEGSKHEYRSLFGRKIGYKWVSGDSRIVLKSSSLTLDSISAREEFRAREAALKDEIGSEL